MKVERFTVQACCGRTSLILRIDQPLSKEILASLVNAGFKEAAHFTKAGILFADNGELIVTGPFGADRVQVKCRIADCNQKLNDFESLLQTLG